MFDRVLKQMREKVRTRRYVMTLHAEEEMNDDDLTIYDIEHCILAGKIVERQRDTATAEWKYRIVGQAFDGSTLEVIAKTSIMGKLVIVTVYLS